MTEKRVYDTGEEYLNKKEPKLKQETIDTLKERAEDITIFEDDEEEEFKKLRREADKDYFIKGKLYFKCYIKLKQNINKLKRQDEDSEDSAPENSKDSVPEDTEFKELKEYFSKITISEEFENNLEYCKSKKFGSVWKEEGIRDYVKEERKVINNFIDLFFEILIQEM